MFRKIGAILTKNQFYEVVNDDDNSGLKDDEVMGEMSFLL